MKKILYGLCIGVICFSLTGCGSKNDKTLEKASSAESLQEEVNNAVISGLQASTHAVAYVTSEKNAEMYELSNKEISEIIGMQEDIHVMEKSADSSEAHKANVTITFYLDSDYGYDELYTMYESGGCLYLDKGWNDDGEFIYYKLRSDKLTEWINLLKESASGTIDKEAW